MYYNYFGLSQPPFRITPDTSLFYPGGDRGAILEALTYAILNGEGIVKVVGEVGSGKTMLCRMLEKELPESVEVVYLVNPSLSPENTLHAIAFELKLNVSTDTSRFEVMTRLQEYLLERHSQNRQVVVFVEEAQGMPLATLEEIRLLSNLETRQSKLLQIVLFGQPELDEKIARPEIRQLKERITYSFQLAPFKTDDIREYLNSRLRACGYRAGDLFDKDAIKLIELYSMGLLRRINILADKSLLAAFAANLHKVHAREVKIAARDSEFLSKMTRFSRSFVVMTGFFLLILAIIGLLLLLPEADVRESANGPAKKGSPAPSVSGTTLPDPVRKPPQVTSDVAVPDPGGHVDDQDDYPVVRTVEVEPFPDMAQESGPGDTLNAAVDTVTNGDLLPARDAGPVTTAASPVADSPDGLEEQLLDVSVIYRLQDIVSADQDSDEVNQLQQSIERLPPEAVESPQMSLSGDTCEQCWSIIYRPVRTSENL